jgi:hypothetical protein
VAQFLTFFHHREETIQEKPITGEANAKKNDHVKLFEKGGRAWPQDVGVA